MFAQNIDDLMEGTEKYRNNENSIDPTDMEQRTNISILDHVWKDLTVQSPSRGQN
jgi:hypothetical protein